MSNLKRPIKIYFYHLRTQKSKLIAYIFSKLQTRTRLVLMIKQKIKYLEQLQHIQKINNGYCDNLKISPDNQFIAIVQHQSFYKTDENGQNVTKYSSDGEEYETILKYYFEVVD
ncbi:hypothetical protein pb186bvf_008006 [Paramecium bursaria]